MMFLGGARAVVLSMLVGALVMVGPTPARAETDTPAYGGPVTGSTNGAWVTGLALCRVECRGDGRVGAGADGRTLSRPDFYPLKASKESGYRDFRSGADQLEAGEYRLHFAANPTRSGTRQLLGYFKDNDGTDEAVSFEDATVITVVPGEPLDLFLDVAPAFAESSVYVKDGTMSFRSFGSRSATVPRVRVVARDIPAGATVTVQMRGRCSPPVQRVKRVSRSGDFSFVMADRRAEKRYGPRVKVWMFVSSPEDGSRRVGRTGFGVKRFGWSC